VFEASKYKIPTYEESVKAILNSAPIQIFCLVVLFHFEVTKNFGLPVVLGDKKNALFDLWSINHFLSGVVFSTALYKYLEARNYNTFKYYVVFLACAASGWEILELTIEHLSQGATLFIWLNGNEHWANRLIGDYVMFVLGGLLGFKMKSAWKFSIILLLLLLAANALLPSSMYLQEIIFNKR